MKYKKGDRVRVVDYDPGPIDPNYATIVGKTGTVMFDSVFVNVMLDDMPVDMDHVWLFTYGELEMIE